MSRGVNKAIIIGTAGKDTEVRYSASGSAFGSVSVVTSEQWKDKTTGEKKEDSQWHAVKFFGRLAEIAGEYLRKGSQVYIEGKIKTEKYTDKAGVERYTTFIVADEMQLLGGKPQGQAEKPASRPQQSGPATPPLDDIPW